MGEVQNQINDLVHKEPKNTHAKQQEEKTTQKNEDSINSFWDNIHITRVPEGEKKDQETVSLFERIMKENIPNLVKEIDMKVQQAQRVPNKMDAKRPTPRHIIIKMPKVKSSKR